MIMKKCLMIICQGFEEIEALGTVDILKRSDISVELGTYNASLTVKSQQGLRVKVDKYMSDVNLDDYDCLIIPGGRAVWEILQKTPKVLEVIKDFNKKNKLIAAICAAPSLLEMAGLLTDVEFTCYPGCEQGLGIRLNSGVHRAHNIITAKSAFYSIDFALTIVEYLAGQEKAKETLKRIKGEQ